MSFKDINSVALSSLKQQSENLLREYTEEYLENAKREEILEPIEEIVRKHTNFWSAIWTNIVAAILYSLIIAIVIFTATAAVPDTKFSKIIRILLDEAPKQNNPETSQ